MKIVKAYNESSKEFNNKNSNIFEVLNQKSRNIVILDGQSSLTKNKLKFNSKTKILNSTNTLVNSKSVTIYKNNSTNSILLNKDKKLPPLSILNNNTASNERSEQKPNNTFCTPHIYKGTKISKNTLEYKLNNLKNNSKYLLSLEQRKILSKDNLKKMKVNDMVDEFLDKPENKIRSYYFNRLDKDWNAKQNYLPPGLPKNMSKPSLKLKIILDSEKLFKQKYCPERIKFDDFSKIYLNNRHMIGQIIKQNHQGIDRKKSRNATYNYKLKYHNSDANTHKLNLNNDENNINVFHDQNNTSYLHTDKTDKCKSQRSNHNSNYNKSNTMSPIGLGLLDDGKTKQKKKTVARIYSNSPANLTYKKVSKFNEVF